MAINENKNAIWFKVVVKSMRYNQSYVLEKLRFFLIMSAG